MPYRDHLTKEALKELEKHAEDGLWNPDYVTYDEQGTKAVSCMRCGTQVMRRVEMEATCPNCNHHFMVESPILSPLSNYARMKHQLPNGSYAELILCVDCLPIVQREEAEHGSRIDAQIAAGLTKEMVKAGRSKEAIDRQMETFKEKR